MRAEQWDQAPSTLKASSVSHGVSVEEVPKQQSRWKMEGGGGVVLVGAEYGWGRQERWLRSPHKERIMIKKGE